MLEMRRDYPEMSIDEIHSSIIYQTTGATASVVFIEDKRLVVANAGDCQAVLARNCNSTEGPIIIDLQKTIHQLHDINEVNRVRSAGLTVEGSPPRINRDLAVSRSFGDFRYKRQGSPLLPPDQQPVSVVPDIMCHQINSEDDFIIIGSDGIFEVFNSIEVINNVLNSLKHGFTPIEALEKLLDDCLCPIDSNETKGKDNMTAMIIFLKDL